VSSYGAADIVVEEASRSRTDALQKIFEVVVPEGAKISDTVCGAKSGVVCKASRVWGACRPTRTADGGCHVVS